MAVAAGLLGCFLVLLFCVLARRLDFFVDAAMARGARKRAETRPRAIVGMSRIVVWRNDDIAPLFYSYLFAFQAVFLSHVTKLIKIGHLHDFFGLLQGYLFRQRWNLSLLSHESQYDFICQEPTTASEEKPGGGGIGGESFGAKSLDVGTILRTEEDRGQGNISAEPEP